MRLFRQPVPTPRGRHVLTPCYPTRGVGPQGALMIGLVRAATLCAALALGLVTAKAAEKGFKRDDLADSAIKLEAQIKSEAGSVAKANPTLKADADAAFKRGY